MKNLFKSVITILAVVFSISNQAQTKALKLENSLLWEVSGNGLSKPSFLYGTIHMICDKDYFLTEQTKKAFATSDKLVLEINMTDPHEMSEMQKMAMGKQPLSTILTAKELEDLDAILKKTSGMNIQQVDAFSLITVMSLISMKTFDCTEIKFYEMNFATMAKERNLQISGLETVSDQMKSFENAYTNQEMIAMLKESSKEETAQMVLKYKEENITTLYNMITDEKLTNEKTKKVILDKRNENWLRIMPEMMQKESVFFAVGSAHLAGEFGIINLLREAGFTVKAITK